jgi:hypothetical protein
VGLAELVVLGEDDEDAAGTGPPRQLREAVERQCVGVMGVVDQDHYRDLLGEVEQVVAQAVEQGRGHLADDLRCRVRQHRGQHPFV